MNQWLFMLTPIGLTFITVSIGEMAGEEPLRLEFEGSAMATPSCSLSGAREGRLGFDPAFPGMLSSREGDGSPGSIEYKLNAQARARIFLTSPTGIFRCARFGERPTPHISALV